VHDKALISLAGLTIITWLKIYVGCFMDW
jgi:hypothetical protein